MEQVHAIVDWDRMGNTLRYQSLPREGRIPEPTRCTCGYRGGLLYTLQVKSGRQPWWSGFTRVPIGNVRLLDPKGRVHESSSKP